MRSIWMPVAVGLLAVALLVGCRAGGGAASFPSRQLNYLVTFDPGGQSDREARRQQPLLEQYFGQKVIIDYKVGGGGALGWAELARSRPNGYTFAGINLPHIVLQPLLQDTGYVTEQLRPIAMFQRTVSGLAVLDTSPYQTLEDLLNTARERPGEVSVGGSGTFSGHHFITLRLNQLTGAKLTYVPFSGAAPSITAFLGGHTTAILANSDDAVKYRDRIRVLAVTGEKRFEAFPDAPTLRERNVDIVEVTDRGVAVPKGTPDLVVQKLEGAFLQIANDPAVQEAQRREGFVLLAMGSAETEAHIQKLTAYYRELLKEMEQQK